jgi:two-component system cell cycle response regulator
MSNEWPRPDGGGRPETDPITPSPARLAVVAAAAVACAYGVRRCLRRTARLVRETAELTILARTDPLTGLHNRRHMEEHLAAAVSAARRHHHSLAVLFIDVDSFKRINDRWGYEAGDDVLRTVGDRVRHALRTEDLVARWGGEEFVVVLPETDLAGAVIVGERVRTAIACAEIPTGDRDIHATVSIGCASGVLEPAELIRQATRALRRAKRAGKNQVVAADEPPA